MRLTLHTDFALRVLIHVGLNNGMLTTINEIAQSFGISKAHLMKVVSCLSQRGYLDTVRGRNGGIRLMREPRHINIGQVVRDTEGQLNVVGCLERGGYCCIERVCVLRGALRDASNAFLAVLDTYTLADLIKPQKALSSLLLHRTALRSTAERSGKSGGNGERPLTKVRPATVYGAAALGRPIRKAMEGGGCGTKGLTATKA